MTFVDLVVRSEKNRVGSEKNHFIESAHSASVLLSVSNSFSMSESSSAIGTEPSSQRASSSVPSRALEIPQDLNFYNVQFQEISILPPGNSILFSYIASKTLAFKTPLPLGISNDLPWGWDRFFSGTAQYNDVCRFTILKGIIIVYLINIVHNVFDRLQCFQ